MARASHGDPGKRESEELPVTGELLELVYEELHRIANRVMSRERSDHTLQPTALIHEAYLRLSELRKSTWKDRSGFFVAVASTMRRVLVDHARARGTDKRGGSWSRLTLAGLPLQVHESAVDALDLEEALSRLDQLDPTVARVVELRFFAGLTLEETASAVQLGVTTVKEKWDFARTWLKKELGGKK